MPGPRRFDPALRDAAVRRVRRVTTSATVGAAALSAAFSVVAAHATKLHKRSAPRRATVAVAGPQHVPTIAPRPRAPRTAPSSAPAPAATPAPAPAPSAAPAPAPPPPPPPTSGSS